MRTAVISSTVLDLPDHREKVREACELQEVFPLMMEHLPASSADAISASVSLVDRADCYIGVIANRYGYIPPGYDISITEMEYNRAAERGIVRLIFVASLRHPPFAGEAETGDRAAKLQSLIERLNATNIVKRFSSPEELKSLVIHALSRTGEQQRPAGARERERYLRHLREHLENLQRESLQNARFIDLGIADSPAATTLPGRYRNSERTREFGSLRQALHAYENRMLLLGSPGGGKTTILQHLALEFVRVAQQNPSAPIPVLVNLSKFSVYARKPSRFERFALRGGAEPGLPGREFERWLEDEIRDLYDVPRQIARSWVAGGRIATFFDGLDEVVLEKRAEIVGLLNETYLRDYPDTVVVVCSRIAEYQPLMDDAGTRLRLPGAVTLQPLEDVQLEQYLRDARAPGLAEALSRDSSLKTLARTPLMLSMMAMAYGNSPAEEIPADASQTVQRHRLMQTFTARMQQRKERRDRRIPFDSSTRDAVPEKDYAWRPSQFERYLGWLALRLSLRSQTACSVRAFWDLVRIAPNRLNRRVDSWVRRGSYTVLLLILITVIGAALAANGALLALLVCKAVAGAMALYWAGILSQKVPGSLAKFLNGIAHLGVLFVLFGAVMLGMAALIPLHLNWLAIEMIVWCVFLTLVLGVRYGFLQKDFLVANAVQLSVAGALTAAYLGFFRHSAILQQALQPEDSTQMPDYDGLFALAIPAVAHATFWSIFTSRTGGAGTTDEPMHLGYTLFAGGIAVGILGLSSEVASGIDLPWAIGLVALVLVSFAEDGASGSTLTLTALAAACGGWIADQAGLFGGLGVAACMVALSLALLTANRVPQRLQTLLRDIAGVIDRTISRAILAPAARSLLAVTGRLPYRLVPLLRYASEALILKPYRGEIEFAHRLLRDYYALGELVPRLRTSRGEQRLPLIDALGYQGAAAIDTLAELSLEGNVDQRSAALAALSRIAAPEVAELLRTALCDPEPEIRAAAVLGLRNLPQEKREQLAATVAEDPAVAVQKALFTIASREAREQMVPRFVREPELLVHLLTLQDLPRLAPNDDRLLTADGLPLKLDTSFAKQVAAALRAMLADPGPRTREKAARWMQCCHPVFDRDALIAVLKADPDRLVCEAAVDALRQWDHFRALEDIASYREVALQRRLAGRILVYIRKELGSATWKITRRAQIPASIVIGSLIVLMAFGPVYVAAAVNWVAAVAATAAIFIPLYRVWYSELGRSGTFHQNTKWWDLGWRGSRLAKRVLFLLVCAASGAGLLVVKNPEWSPLPSYAVNPIVLRTVSGINVWPGEPVREYRFGDAVSLYDVNKSHAVHTAVADTTGAGALRSLPLVNVDQLSDRPYRWQGFDGVHLIDYMGYLKSSPITVALRPGDYDKRLARIPIEGSLSWVIPAGAADLLPAADEEVSVVTMLKQNPSVRRAWRFPDNVDTRLVGWASMSLAGREIGAGPLLLIAKTGGTFAVEAILAGPGTFSTDCQDSLSELSRRCR